MAKKGGGGGRGGGSRPAPAPAPRPAPPPPKPAPTPSKSQQSGNSTNQAIQKKLENAGSTVSYKEAAKVADKLGVSVDRVLNQTNKTGQSVHIGQAAVNAGYTPSAQAKYVAPSAPAAAQPQGNPVNQQIQAALGSAGKTVNYNEAAAVAAQLGVSVDRVFNQTNKTGQDTKLGAAAYAAGYTGENSKVNPTIGASYQAAQFTDQYNQQQAAFQAELDALYAGAGDMGQQPTFDWEAWNSQMMAQQAAVWESMDAMNSEFLRQQQEYLSQQSSQPRRSGSIFGGGPSADPAAVKRKKRTKSNSGTKTNTGLGIGSTTGGAAGSGLSLGGGGGGGNGLAIGKNK